jgi:hypothetical protein
MRASSFLKKATLFGAPLLGSVAAQADDGSFTGSFHQASPLASRVPANGDVNPYGVAVVPRSTGALVKGHILVSKLQQQ